MRYEWRCTGCDVQVEVTRPMDQCNVPPTLEETCGCTDVMGRPYPQWARVYSAPMVMAASFPDGTKRPGFAEMREKAKLEVEMANRPRERRADIAKEIRKLSEAKK